MQVPGLGEVTKDERSGWFYSQPLKLQIFNDKVCQIVLEGYEEELNREDFHVAIKNFLACAPAVLKEAEACIFEYYTDMNSYWAPSDEQFVSIKSPSDIWAHIQLGIELIVSRRGYGDKGIYISVECNCDWEPEHGLQIVFKDGAAVCKVGPYDGHLTNSDAYADESLEHVIYRGMA